MSETQHGNDARNAAADGELTADSTLTAQMAPDYRPVAPVAPFSRSVWLQIALYLSLIHIFLSTMSRVRSSRQSCSESITVSLEPEAPCSICSSLISLQ